MPKILLGFFAMLVIIFSITVVVGFLAIIRPYINGFNNGGNSNDC